MFSTPKWVGVKQEVKTRQLTSTSWGWITSPPPRLMFHLISAKTRHLSGFMYPLIFLWQKDKNIFYLPHPGHSCLYADTMVDRLFSSDPSARLPLAASANTVSHVSITGRSHGHTGRKKTGVGLHTWTSERTAIRLWSLELLLFSPPSWICWDHGPKLRSDWSSRRKVPPPPCCVTWPLVQHHQQKKRDAAAIFTIKNYLIKSSPEPWLLANIWSAENKQHNA